MYVHSYLQSALHILGLYRGETPFAAWLKAFFKDHKKYGARDRKTVAHLCYCYFRLGKSFAGLDEKDRIIVGLFLCSTESNALLEGLRPEWNQHATKSVAEKLKLLNVDNERQKLFPWPDELSLEIDAVAFGFSFFVQPDMYLRLRPAKEESVKQKLQQSGLSFWEISTDVVALPNGTKVDAVLALDDEAVVQDFSSQQTLNPLFAVFPSPQKIVVWDCCAASGGKSILLKDRWPDCRLTVSDIRESILVNLRKRFERAGIQQYDWFVADLLTNKFFSARLFDAVICDAPCTGSGTWSRTPEQLSFFDEKRIDEYAAKQKATVTNVVKGLKPNGYLLYITCSVFKKENEAVVNFIEGKLALRLQTMQYIRGYDRKADTLFAALLQKL